MAGGTGSCVRGRAVMWRCWLAAALVLATLVTTQVVAEQDAQAESSSAGFYDGVVKYSDIINCVSIIFPPAYTEKGAAAYVGAYADPESGLPGVNQTFYVHVVVYGMGNACAGQRFVPAFALPSNLSFDKSASILCYTQRGQAFGDADCPQWDNVTDSGFSPGSMYLSSDAAYAHAWPLPQGASWEFRFPVRSSTTQTSANLQGYVKMFDGNDSPVLTPSAPLYVFGAGGAPVVMYDRPSTFAFPNLPETTTPTAFGILSTGQVIAKGQGGTVLYRRGTSPGSYSSQGELPVGAGYNSFWVWTDWNEAGFAPVRPDQRYFWQLGFDPGARGGGDTVWGREQSFTGLWATTCQGQPVTVALGLGQLPTSGVDVILGTPGDDDVQGGGGADTICAGPGADHVDGGAGPDRVDAGGGNDLVLAAGGDDVLKGGAGTDTASYAGATTAVRVSLAAAGVQSTGGGGNDRLSTFERLGGGDRADTLIGNDAGNRLAGGKGPDTLRGGKGRDVCDGGPGTDRGASCEKTIKIP